MFFFLKFTGPVIIHKAVWFIQYSVSKYSTFCAEIFKILYGYCNICQTLIKNKENTSSLDHTSPATKYVSLKMPVCYRGLWSIYTMNWKKSMWLPRWSGVGRHFMTYFIRSYIIWQQIHWYNLVLHFNLYSNPVRQWRWNGKI